MSARMGRAGPAAGLATVIAALTLAAAVAVAAFGLSGGGAVVLVVLQGLGVLSLLVRGGSVPVIARPAFVLGVFWAFAFLVPSIVYVVDERRLDVGNLRGTLAVTGAALFSLLFGLALGARAARPQVTPGAWPVPPRDVEVRWDIAARWVVVGLVALGVLLANAGGPLAYVTNLGSTVGLNAGLFYVIWVILAIRFAACAAAIGEWGSGRPLSWRTRGLIVFSMGVMVLLGARLFVVVEVAQLAIMYVLVRRPLPLRRLLPLAAIGGVAIVFGLGTVKRYSSYQTQGGQASLLTYATTTARAEFVDAYTNNYADGVRLTALARQIVPSQAPYEGLTPLLGVVLKPIPSGLRPTAPRDARIDAVFGRRGDVAYAVPLQAGAYLAGGLVAVVLAMVAVGWAVARLDRLLDDRRSLWALATLVAAVVQLPVFLRSGLPNGAAFLVVEVLGMAAVCRTMLRERDRAPGS